MAGYKTLLADVAKVIQEARRATVHSVNAVMTATYWLVERRVVEQEQKGKFGGYFTPPLPFPPFPEPAFVPVLILIFVFIEILLG